MIDAATTESAAPREMALHTDASTTPEPVSILLVDDRPENLLALEAILEPLGQRLVRAHSGEEALRCLLHQDFAAILLDVQMPGLNGFETAELIKSRERSRHIPIIFLTAISKEEEYVFRGYEVGAVDYMSKPFQPDILRSKVAVFVDLYRKQQQLRRQEDLLRQGERREIELRHKAELWEREQRLAEIVDGALDAIVTFDADSRISLFNAAAERMFGARAADALGKSARRFFPALGTEFLERACSPRPSGPGGGGSGVAEIEAFNGRRASGEEFPIEASISCLDLPSGRLYTVIGRDVSERKRAEAALRSQAISLANTSAELKATNEELNRRQVELEKAMTARSRFYASMSHELRTPINAILGYNTLMLEGIYGPLTEKQREGLERTQKAARHLLELVNDVLDLSKIEAGKIELKPQPVRFPGLIDDLFVTVRPMADQRGTHLTLHHEGEPFSVTSDPRRVRQILLNLLSNAIKFGRGRPIRVESCATPTGGVEIAVIDQGEGIAADDLPRIFDEFVQLATPGKHHHEGTGLGLPISKRLATLLHGRLEVTSQPGVGSAFRLVLPRELDPRAGVGPMAFVGADRPESRGGDASIELHREPHIEPMSDVAAASRDENGRDAPNDTRGDTQRDARNDARGESASEPRGESRSGAGV